MGYDITISPQIIIGIILATLLGFLVLLSRLREWVVNWLERAEKYRNRNKRVVMFAYNGVKDYRFYFDTVQEAAAFTIKRMAKVGDVARIELDGKTIWGALWHDSKNSLRQLAEQ